MLCECAVQYDHLQNVALQCYTSFISKVCVCIKDLTRLAIRAAKHQVLSIACAACCIVWDCMISPVFPFKEGEALPPKTHGAGASGPR